MMLGQSFSFTSVGMFFTSGRKKLPWVIRSALNLSCSASYVKRMIGSACSTCTALTAMLWRIVSMSSSSNFSEMLLNELTSFAFWTASIAMAALPARCSRESLSSAVRCRPASRNTSMTA